jgi:hypothetical protein
VYVYVLLVIVATCTLLLGPFGFWLNKDKMLTMTGVCVFQVVLRIQAGFLVVDAYCYAHSAVFVVYFI